MDGYLIRIIFLIVAMMLISCESDGGKKYLDETDLTHIFEKNVQSFTRLLEMVRKDISNEEIIELGSREKNISHLTEERHREYISLLAEVGSERVSAYRKSKDDLRVSFLLKSSGFVFAGCISELTNQIVRPDKPSWSESYIHKALGNNWHGETKCN